MLFIDNLIYLSTTSSRTAIIPFLFADCFSGGHNKIEMTSLLKERPFHYRLVCVCFAIFFLIVSYFYQSKNKTCDRENDLREPWNYRAIHLSIVAILTILAQQIAFRPKFPHKCTKLTQIENLCPDTSVSKRVEHAENAEYAKVCP